MSDESKFALMAKPRMFQEFVSKMNVQLDQKIDKTLYIALTKNF